MPAVGSGASVVHLREKTPVMTSQVLNRCVPCQDASLGFVDELSVKMPAVLQYALPPFR